jgi:deoxyribonuclease-4
VGNDKKNQFPPYAYEIKMLQEQKFNPALKEQVVENAGKLV